MISVRSQKHFLAIDCCVLSNRLTIHSAVEQALHEHTEVGKIFLFLEIHFCAVRCFKQLYLYYQSVNSLKRFSNESNYGRSQLIR